LIPYSAGRLGGFVTFFAPFFIQGLKMAHQKILILDFGSQVTQLIARRVREHQVYCELHSYDVSEEFIRNFNPQASFFRAAPTRSMSPGFQGAGGGFRARECRYSGFAMACRPWPRN